MHEKKKKDSRVHATSSSNCKQQCCTEESLPVRREIGDILIHSMTHQRHEKFYTPVAVRGGSATPAVLAIKTLTNDHFRRNADCMQLMTFIAGFNPCIKYLCRYPTKTNGDFSRCPFGGRIRTFRKTHPYKPDHGSFYPSFVPFDSSSELWHVYWARFLRRRQFGPGR